ncbi:hypothetical protein NMG60_11023091 [Bertholletia excelsa]
MENGWSLFSNNSSTATTTTSGGSRGQSGNCGNLPWQIWEFGTNTSRFDWTTSTISGPLDSPSGVAAITAASEDHALMAAASLYGGGGAHHHHPDPHLMCLKLGKRHYFEDATGMGERHVAGVGVGVGKRGRGYCGSGGGGGGGAVVAGAVPRCQVDGCHVALVNVKDYHRRHKVCEMHSKAPKVVVLGLEQRFCQQCSRFHAVSEFDDSKRSCRRRLAGHNERRRKGSHDSIPRNNPSQGRALSLLSSKNNSWFSSADLSSRCSAALRELIAENRAASLARQLVLERDSWHSRAHQSVYLDLNPAQGGPTPLTNLHHELLAEPDGWDRYNEEGGGQVTLDLMQAPSSAFGFLSVRGKSKEEEEECSELWSSLGGAHLV